MASSIATSLPPTCRVTIPSATDPVSTYLGHRWMHHKDSHLPAAVLVPSNEEDVVAVVQYAAAHGLQIVPSGGGKAAFVVTSEKSIYLDLSGMRGVSVDEDKETVTVGAGSVWKDVMEELIPRGFYTAWTNYSSVGVIGSLLAGGLSPFIGTTGYACDTLLSARILTASGQTITLSVQSTAPADTALFNMLRGAGIGLCVVLAATLRMYKTATTLSLEGGTRTVNATAIFPVDAWETVCTAFSDLTTPEKKDKRLSGTILATNSPPQMPVDPQPVLVVTVHFTGTEAAARHALESILDGEVGKAALMTKVESVELARMNEQADARFQTGNVKGHNDVFNALLAKPLRPETLLASAHRWLALREQVGAEAAGRVLVVAAVIDNTAAMKLDPDRRTGFAWRERRVVGQVVLLDVAEGDVARMTDYAQEAIGILRRDDDAGGEERAVYLANARVSGRLEEMYGGRLAELRRVKGVWDPEGVFWCPAVDGW